MLLSSSNTLSARFRSYRAVPFLQNTFRSLIQQHYSSKALSAPLSRSTILSKHFPRLSNGNISARQFFSRHRTLLLVLSSIFKTTAVIPTPFYPVLTTADNLCFLSTSSLNRHTHLGYHTQCNPHAFRNRHATIIHFSRTSHRIAITPHSNTHHGNHTAQQPRTTTTRAHGTSRRFPPLFFNRCRNFFSRLFQPNRTTYVSISPTTAVTRLNHTHLSPLPRKVPPPRHSDHPYGRRNAAAAIHFHLFYRFFIGGLPFSGKRSASDRPSSISRRYLVDFSTLFHRPSVDFSSSGIIPFDAVQSNTIPTSPPIKRTPFRFS